MGNVCCKWDVSYIASQLASSLEEKDYIIKHLFQTKQWAQLDQGVLSLQDAKKQLIEQISDKKIEISDLMQKENEETLKKNAELTKQQASINISIDPDATTADKIIQAAYSQLGVPYVWGGTTPNVGLDCSGLTQWCYSQAGISLPRLAEAQGSGTQISEPTPGCLVAYPHHIAIFLKQDTDGTRWMIAAPKTGDVVKIQKVYGNPWYVRWF